MAVIGDADQAPIVVTVAGRVRGQILGREGAADDAAMAVAEVAVEYVIAAAPKTPTAIGTEAAVRFAGWLYGNRPHVRGHEFTDPSGTMLKLDFAGSATANGFRASGASALVSRFVRRRAGAIG